LELKSKRKSSKATIKYDKYGHTEIRDDGKNKIIYVCSAG